MIAAATAAARKRAFVCPRFASRTSHFRRPLRVPFPSVQYGLPMLSAKGTARHVLVRGRVQGVGFRYAVQERARSRGVAGHVRNLPEGEVEAVFEGEPDAVGALVEFCRRGPRGAEVTGVDVRAAKPSGRAGFDVR